MKRTKIVCTIGPASASHKTLVAMIKSGMNVARLNFSHGTHASHKKLISLIRAAAKDAGEPVAILGDLQGPKIRLGELPEAGVNLATGAAVAFSTTTQAYKAGLLPVTYKGLHKDVKKNHRILIDDGLIEVRITSVKGSVIHATVVNGGVVTSHKGMNFPDSTLRVSSLTEKDKKDIVFGVQNGVDWMALSFVTSPQDVKTLRGLIKRAGKKQQVLPRIIVKIEKHEAIRRFKEILAVTDAVMVARGDLGIEIPAEEVPVRQKELIAACRAAGKPVVVATQMLDSMIRNPRPTRAEVSDVANAVFDHTDAVMLSGESATGKYPLQAVKTMAAIVERSEASVFDDLPPLVAKTPTLQEDVALAVKVLADDGHISAVVTATALVPWAETLFRSRPEIPLFIAASSETEGRQMNIRWGVRSIVMKSVHTKTFVNKMIGELLKRKWVKRGQRVAVLVGGAKHAGFDIVQIL